PSLELQVGEKPLSIVERKRLEAIFQITQLLERAAAACPRLPRNAAPQVSSGATHLLRDLPRLSLIVGAGPSRLSLGPLGKFFNSLAQVGLIFRELLELPLSFGVGAVRVRETLLTTEELVLAPREIADLFQRVTLRLRPSLCVVRLVGCLLLAPQL